MSGGHASIREILYESPGPRAKRRITAFTAASIIGIAAMLILVVRQFYINGQLDIKYWFFFAKFTTWRFLGEGLAGTLKVAFVSSILAFFIALVLMIARISKYRILRWVSTVFIELSRGIPTLLFIYFFFLVAPQFGIKLPTFFKIALPVALSATGVVAEVLRSGVNAVPKGQTEAAIALGMREWSVFLRIAFPQAFRYVIPSLISEIVIVLKDVTFAYVVSYADLMQNARVLISNYDALLSVYLVVALIYILINYLINKISIMLVKHRNVTKLALQ